MTNEERQQREQRRMVNAIVRARLQGRRLVRRYVELLLDLREADPRAREEFDASMEAIVPFLVLDAPQSGQPGQPTAAPDDDDEGRGFLNRN